MPKIFLCYRAQEDAYAAALLDEKLSEAFGRDEVFRASRSIKPGERYPDAIARALKECDTLLAIIGPRWAESLADSESSMENDWVRTEISTALENGARVVPLLLSRTPRLDARELPSDIVHLAERQYMVFDHRDVDGGIERLVAALQAD